MTYVSQYQCQQQHMIPHLVILAGGARARELALCP